MIASHSDVYSINLIRNNRYISNTYNYRMEDVNIDINQF